MPLRLPDLPVLLEPPLPRYLRAAGPPGGRGSGQRDAERRRLDPGKQRLALPVRTAVLRGPLEHVLHRRILRRLDHGRSERGDRGGPLRRRFSGLENPLEERRLRSSVAAQQRVDRQRIVAEALDERKRGRFPSRRARRHGADGRCELMTDRPVRIVELLEHRRLERHCQAGRASARRAAVPTPGRRATCRRAPSSQSKVRSRRYRRASIVRAGASASPGALSARSFSAGTTDRSPRSTSSRCAVSRHQPFGCASASTSCAGVGLRQRRRSVRASSCRARRGRSARDHSADRACATESGRADTR